MSGTRHRLTSIVPLAVAQVAGVLCGLIGVRWSSAVVAPEAMGVYGLLLSAQQLATTVTHHGLIKHVQQHWTLHTPGRRYLRLMIRAAGWPAVWLAGALAVVTFYFRLSTGLPLPLVWWAWLVAANLLGVVVTVGQSALYAENRFWAGSGVTSLGSATRSFLPPLFVVLGGAALPMLGVGYLLHAALFAMAGLWCLRHAWHRTENAQPPLPSPAAVLRTFLGVGLFGWLAAAAPRWFAAQSLDTATTGYFMLATNLAMIVPATASLIGQNFSFPALFAASRSGTDLATLRRQTDRTVFVVMFSAQAGIVLLAALAPWLIGVVIDHRYAPAIGWVTAAGGGILATLSGPFFCNLLIARERPKACVWLSLISAALRFAILGTLSALKNPEALRLGLCLLPWPTLAVEWGLTRYWTAARPPPAAPP